MDHTRPGQASSSNAGMRRRAVGYSVPASSPSISIANGGGIKDRSLLALARTLLNLDREMLAMTAVICEATINGRLNAHDPNAANEARDELSKATDIDNQINQIKLGDAVFHPEYLEQRYFVTVWQKAMNIFRQIIPHELGPNLPPDATKDYSRKLSELETKTEALIEKIVVAASRGSLTRDALLTLEERWVRLDEILDWRQQEYQVPRKLPSWSAVDQRVEEQTKLRAQAAALPPAQTSDFWTSTLILWSTYLVTVVASVPCFALAYRYSEHQPGTTEDADFWFLLQSSLTGLLSIVVSCVSLWSSPKLPKQIWVPLAAIGILCTLFSVVFYLKSPTEWSGFFSILSSSIQAFMVLQIVIGSK